ncbi:MAG: hypothetical protein L0H93_15340, partial [Nocardioides sp.]|nr:hypothetical protein [Nocardioides sp.]
MSGARHHAAYPPRPLLRPGVHVCRREDGRLQVGLDVRLAVTAPDTPEVLALLDGLRHGVPPAPIGELTPAAARLCSALLDRGLVLDGDALWPALGQATTREARESLTAMFVEAGVRGGPTRDHRRGCRVLISNHRLTEASDR